ncbi:DUF7946 domain-containing protein [Xanthobacter autotrophicus]|uniref:DUF7946 domain-containing protein n=1 Tax=Xanthobacter autotrophicus TaxID=280 RepID=UPI0037275D96
MAQRNSFALKLRYCGETVNEKGLDLYDGATSFQGFSQALQIVVHAYLRNEVVSRATALKGAEIFFSSPRNGSVLFDIIAIIEAYPATVAVGAAPFYDFIKLSFSKAIGLVNVAPETSYVSKLNTKDEPFFDAIAEQIEGPLQRGHRCLDSGVTSITLERPRSPLVTFNSASRDWVNTRDENPDAIPFTGNMTRYNSITGNGRAYIQQLKRIVPIRPAQEFPFNKKGYLTWSLHGSNVDTSKELVFRARRIESARGEVKRLVLLDCDPAAAAP